MKARVCPVQTNTPCCINIKSGYNFSVALIATNFPLDKIFKGTAKLSCHVKLFCQVGKKKKNGGKNTVSGSIRM